MITIEQIREIALALPGASEHASYGGRPSWRTKKRMFTWVRDDPEALVVWVDSVAEKEAMLAADPSPFFTTDHYDGHPIVLVDLATVEPDEAAELIADSFRCRAEKRLVAELDAREG